MHDLDAASAPWVTVAGTVASAAAVVAAVRTGVMESLGGERHAAAIARRAGCDRRGVELVLDVLVDAGVVIRDDDGGYALPAGALRADEIADQIDAVEHLVRTGQPVVRVDEPDSAERGYPGVVARLGAAVETLARDLAATECGRRSRPLRMLDVAAGAAPFAIAFARAGAHATALDLASVAVVTERSLAAAGLDDRVRVVAGDLFDVDLDERFDVVVLAGLCRLVGPDRAADAIDRCARWLAPGGTLLVVDAVDTLDTRRRGLARYALGLATRTATGRPHAYPSFGAWLAASGLVDVVLTPTERPEVSVISARLPEGARP